MSLHINEDSVIYRKLTRKSRPQLFARTKALLLIHHHFFFQTYDSNTKYKQITFEHLIGPAGSLRISVNNSECFHRICQNTLTDTHQHTHRWAKFHTSKFFLKPTIYQDQVLIWYITPVHVLKTNFFLRSQWLADP